MNFPPRQTCRSRLGTWVEVAGTGRRPLPTEAETSARPGGSPPHTQRRRFSRPVRHRLDQHEAVPACHEVAPVAELVVAVDERVPELPAFHVYHRLDAQWAQFHERHGHLQLRVQRRNLHGAIKVPGNCAASAKVLSTSTSRPIDPSCCQYWAAVVKARAIHRSLARSTSVCGALKVPHFALGSGGS